MIVWWHPLVTPLIPFHLMFQVRIERSVGVPRPSPPPQPQPESDAEDEAAEQDELLDCNAAAEQQSDWL